MNGVAPIPQRVSTTGLEDAAPVKPPAKTADVIDLMDSKDEFLLQAMLVWYWQRCVSKPR